MRRRRLLPLLSASASAARRRSAAPRSRQPRRGRPPSLAALRSPTPQPPHAPTPARLPCRRRRLHAVAAHSAASSPGGRPAAPSRFGRRLLPRGRRTLSEAFLRDATAACFVRRKSRAPRRPPPPGSQHRRPTDAILPPGPPPTLPRDAHAGRQSEGRRGCRPRATGGHTLPAASAPMMRQPRLQSARRGEAGRSGAGRGGVGRGEEGGGGHRRGNGRPWAGGSAWAKRRHLLSVRIGRCAAAPSLPQRLCDHELTRAVAASAVAPPSPPLFAASSARDSQHRRPSSRPPRPTSPPTIAACASSASVRAADAAALASSSAARASATIAFASPRPARLVHESALRLGARGIGVRAFARASKSSSDRRARAPPIRPSPRGRSLHPT